MAKQFEDNRQNGMDDGGYSSSLLSSKPDTSNPDTLTDDYFKSLLHYHNIYKRNEINLYDKTYRFGLFNPYGTISNTREFLFFTKPDFAIYERNDSSGLINSDESGKYLLSEGLRSLPYWSDLAKSRPRTIEQLQLSVNDKDNFNHLLQNSVISNLEIPGLTADNIETPTNMYGVGFSYRGSSETKDDNFDFSLEFKDTKWLDVYYFFKTYEEYETLKHHGVIRPWKKYIENKIIHDQFSIYKFLVDEDMETIIYFAKFYGVMPTSLPRDVFSNATFENGISYSIEFKAAFFEDMRPEIITDFNYISESYYGSQKYDIDIYNNILGRVDNRAATSAYIEKVKSSISPAGYVYKLRWRGSDKV